MIQEKTIGRMPTHHGDYDPSVAYGKKYRVSLYGCEWESKHDNNNTAPAVWDGGDTITPNTTDWKLISGSFDTWLESLDKPASTGSTGDYPYNGLGRIVLKKKYSDNPNYANKPILEQADFDDANNNHLTNMVFVIKYDFVLTEDITLGAGCVLCFEGGSISGDGNDADTITGNNTGIQAGLVQIFGSNVTLAGTWNIETIDIRWFGVVANDNTIDCTPIIEKIYPLNKKIHFPKGTFYLSALHVVTNSNDDQFYIEGEPGDTVYPATVFRPYTTNQSYIIKAGGSKNKLDGNLGANRAYNINIINIGFRSGDNYNPTNLDSEYNSSADYYFGALILDKVEVGHFAIYGSGLQNTPLLVMGYAYECHFDFITAYGHGVKNDMPLVYIINNQGSEISATYIEKMMCEVCFGPIVKTSEQAAAAEFIINTFIMEGTVTWEHDTLYSNAEPNWSDYNIIPIFELYGNLNFQVNFMSLTRSNTIWDNPMDVSVKHNIRTLLSATKLLSANIVLDNIYNHGQSPYQYICADTDGISYNNYIKVKGCCVEFCKDSVSRYVCLDIDQIYTNRAHRGSLITGKKLYGIELKKLYNPLGIENVGLNCYFQNQDIIDEGYNTNLRVRNTQAVAVNPILNQNGFYVTSDYLVVGIASVNDGYNNWREITVLYKDANDNTLSTYTREDRFYGRKIHNFIIKIDKSVNYDHIVLHYPSVYSLDVMFIAATNDISEYVNTSGTFANKPSGDLVGVGFKYFCTDKQTAEGATDGIEIIHKGSGVWVDALGRTVS